MTESDHDRVHELTEELSRAVHELVDARLDSESSEVDYLVRERLTEQFRFWRRVQ